jgi:hypothetical protein
VVTSIKLIAVAILVLSGMAAQSARAVKPFTVPENSYVLQPAVAKDEGCARDYAKALALQGLEQRKMMAELITYKCVEVLPYRYRALIIESRTFDAGSQHFPMVRVRLSMGGMPVGSNIEKEGWMIRSALASTGQASRPVAAVPDSDRLSEPHAITMATFQLISKGMTYEQIRNFMGSDGQEGVRSVTGGHHTVVYTWKNADGSYLNLMFEDERLMLKGQSGLR